MSTSSRKCLTLQKKVELIKTADRNLGISIRSLSEHFEFGKTQIVEMLKKKVYLLSMYEGNISKSAVQTKISRTSQYSDVNKALYDLFNLASSIQ